MLSVGQRVTLLKIDDVIAMSHRYELEVRSVLEPSQVGYQQSKRRVATVRQRGKRKDFYLDLDQDNILLDGWDQPFKMDTECSGVIAGNACYNLIGNTLEIRQALETKAVFRVTDDAKGKIIVSGGPRTRCDDTGCVLLYPEIRTHHAVINRMKEADEPAIAD